ncbi:MAG TPA: hypothetical protein EYP08_00520 [Pyrodictiaceae archaeon]|nr:hypothetical protein [Pyrodictiaceae archaeon]HIQ56260.1 hypothetical protein [Pyrodictium sp.]
MQTCEKISSDMLCEINIIKEVHYMLKTCYDASLPSNLMLLCRRSEKYVDIFVLLKSSIDKVLEKILESMQMYIVSIGVHIFRKQTAKLLPMLGLLNFIKPRKGYVVVNDEGIKHFLYGKDVLYNNIIKITKLPATCKLPYIVVGPRGEAVGYGRLIVFKGKPLIRNVLDLGWYLRSGV